MSLAQFPPTPPTMSTPWWFFLIAAGLIVMSGFFSGLNLGLMSLAPDELKVVMEGSDNDQAKKDAAKIYPLRKRGNLLLCSPERRRTSPGRRA